MVQAYRVFLALTITFLCVSLAGNISALLGTAWMHVDTIQDGTRMSVEKGLVRSCSEKWTTPRNVSCGMNVQLFTFDKKREWDITASLVIISSGFYLLAVLSAFCMACCCQRRRGAWLGGAITTSIFTLLGALSGLSALVYFEVDWYARTHDRNYNRGWANIVGWIATGLGIGTFAFSCTLACVRPTKRDVIMMDGMTTPVESSYPMTNYNGHHGSSNHGYQDRGERNDWDKNQSYNGVIKEFYATQASI